MEKVRIQLKGMFPHLAPDSSDSPVEWTSNGVPKSKVFGDTYRSFASQSSENDTTARSLKLEDLGLAQSRDVFIQGAKLWRTNPSWHNQEHWTILETGFGLGLNFLSTWDHWLNQDPMSRPKRLTYVSFEQYPVSVEDLIFSAKPWPELHKLAKSLSLSWRGMIPGFHRLSFEGGAITLLVCIGDIDKSILELDLHADSVFLDGHSPKVNPEMWSHKILGRVANLARAGATLSTWCVTEEVVKSLEIHGFKCTKLNGLSPKKHRLEAVYFGKHLGTTQFNSKESHQNFDNHTQLQGRCAVIGAGLAGASAAYAMAKRGWKVTVFDLLKEPAGAASGVPVGIFSTQISKDDNPQSKLSRAGVRFTCGLLSQLLIDSKGSSWQSTGVLEARPNLVREDQDYLINPDKEIDPGCASKDGPIPKPLKKLHSDPQSFELLQSKQAKDWYELTFEYKSKADLRASHLFGSPDIWHSQGGWVEGGVLVRELLAHPNIEFRAGQRITQLLAYKLKKATKSTEQSNQLEPYSADDLIHKWEIKSEPPTASDHPPSNHLEHNVWDHVIVANSYDAQYLLEPLTLLSKGPSPLSELNLNDSSAIPSEINLEITRGQITWGNLTKEQAKNIFNFPVNGAGSFVCKPIKIESEHKLNQHLKPFLKKSSETNTPTINSGELWAWYAGSTFERLSSALKTTLDKASTYQGSDYSQLNDEVLSFQPKMDSKKTSIGEPLATDQYQSPEKNINQLNSQNLEKLKCLYPNAYDAVTSDKVESNFQHWTGLRCNTRNRLPWVQNFMDPQSSLPIGLSVLTGLGSKGIALAPLCAEVLVCEIHQEPCPIERNLAKMLKK